MRVNIYSQEATPEIDRVSKVGADKDGQPAVFHAVRLYLRSGPWLHNTPEDDDRSAITLWLPKSPERRALLAIAFRQLADWIGDEWPGGWPDAGPWEREGAP